MISHLADMNATARIAFVLRRSFIIIGIVVYYYIGIFVMLAYRWRRVGD